MTIDMHSHWRPPVLIDALRARTQAPLIEIGDDGVEVLRSRGGHTERVSDAFDNLEERLSVMDRQGISTAVLSLFGSFQWIEALPLDESLAMLRLHNDALSEICAAHPGRFVAYASLPLVDQDAALAEFDRVMGLDGMVGAIVPGNAFLTYEDAEAFRPYLEAANRHSAILFVHCGPRPGDAWPRVASGSDNMSARLFTLDMQASLSADMMTLCYSGLLEEYPEARIHIHNLGGNIPYEVERLDHRNVIDTPDEPLPSTQFIKPNLYVDCNSLGAQAIECGVAAYGAKRIMFGTDGTEFGSEWSVKALQEARIDDAARHNILHGNAARFLGHLATLAPYQEAAE
jgi:predicted TIM-barrel fold metal-dependent hydrolase